jgi:hypothetical protein
MTCQFERGPLSGDRLGWHDLGSRSGLLDAVVIQNRGQIVQCEPGYNESTFPDDAGVDLTVAQHNVRPAMGFVHTRPERHAGSDSQHRGPEDPRALRRPGVFFGSGWPCRRLFNALKVTSSSTGRNPRGARTVYGMAQAWPLENTNLSRPPIGVCRVQPQLMEVERRRDFGRGKRPANVPGAPALGHAQHLNATFVRAARQIADHLRTVLRALG